jgi:hypothetical protein
MVKRAIAVATVCTPILLGGCKPDLNQTVSIVSVPQILAVRADPGEAPEKGALHFSALVAGAGGRLSLPIEWDFCNAREPLAELGPVSSQCLQATGDWFSPVGVGTDVASTMPTGACSRFGPNVPQATGTQPPGRPVDPDGTGGYYQPVRLVMNGATGPLVGLAETRISCDIPASPDQLVIFKQHYVANTNPKVDSLTAGSTALVTDDSGQSNAVAAGQALALQAAWAACPRPTGVCGDQYCDLSETPTSCPADCMNPAPCTGAETYVNLDLASSQLVTQREGMEVAWFATAGSFDNDRTGTAPDDPTPFTTNTWRAPSPAAAGGRVYLWVVLRDDRGGVGWAEYALDVH